MLTLRPAMQPGGLPSGFCLLCGTRGLADFICNLVLFVPFGASLYIARVRASRAACAALLLSLIIEALQVSIVSGRDASIGDLVSNTLGGFAGFGIAGLWASWSLAAATTGAYCLRFVVLITGVVNVGTLGFLPYFSHRPYYLQWAAEPGGTEVFQGTIESFRIGSFDLRVPPWRIVEEDSVRRILDKSDFEIGLVAGPETGGLAPLVAIYDDGPSQVWLTGQDGRDLVLRHMMIADVLRLDKIGIRFRDAFDGVRVGSRIDLRIERENDRFCLRQGAYRRCPPPLAAGDTWALLSAQGLGERNRLASGAFWLFLLFFPAGLLARRLSTVGVACAAAAAGLVGVPLLSGLPLPRTLHVVAAAGAITAGFCAYRVFHGVLRERRRPFGAATPG